VTAGGAERGWKDEDCDDIKNVICEKKSDVNLVACIDYCKNGAQCIVGVDEVECKCPPGFAGKRCDVNLANVPECQASGSTKMNGTWRQESNMNPQTGACDALLTGWFRFEDGDRMKESCIYDRNRCGVQWPGHVSGGHPSVGDGVVERNIYFNSYYCTSDVGRIQIRNCGVFYVYKYLNMPNYSTACNYGACLKDRGTF